MATTWCVYAVHEDPQCAQSDAEHDTHTWISYCPGAEPVRSHPDNTRPFVPVCAPVLTTDKDDARSLAAMVHHVLAARHIRGDWYRVEANEREALHTLMLTIDSSSDTVFPPWN